ncbi:hypothetical protein GCM10020370_60710 [Paenibacillus hodogayensis]
MNPQYALRIEYLPYPVHSPYAQIGKANLLVSYDHPFYEDVPVIQSLSKYVNF